MSEMFGLLQRTLAAALLLLNSAALTSAQAAWPDRPVRILAGAAGSSGDAAARTLAESLAKRWKQPVVVENQAPITSSLCRAW